MYIVLIKLNFISLFPKYLHTMVTYIESLASKFQWHFDIMEKVSTEDDRLRGTKMFQCLSPCKLFSRLPSDVYQCFDMIEFQKDL